MARSEKQREYDRKYREKNKEKLAAYQKEWKEKNREHLKQYYEENREYLSARYKEYRETHKEEIKENWNEWYQKNKTRSPQRRFTESKYKAINKRKLEWTLTLEEYKELINQPCFYCKNKLGEPVKRSCGLDRLDSNLGYISGNVVSCCYVCNCIKNSFLSPEETQSAVKAILRLRFKKEGKK